MENSGPPVARGWNPLRGVLHGLVNLDARQAHHCCQATSRRLLVSIELSKKRMGVVFKKAGQRP
jgi:hypothetical protein